MTLETGTVLNNIYRVVKLLGKGSMGHVYLMERIEDDKKFVVKELNFSPEVGLDISSAKEIFRREAEFMAKFDHHGLPRTYGVFSQNEKEYLTMDYIEGKTLEEIITSSEGPVRGEDAIKWTLELADILNYLHNSFHQPIVYRDLKPANIIIKPDGKPVLVDFGIARYYNPDREHDTFNYGSPGYAAPEQYKGRGRSTPQSDIFGLGVILFQMLTGYDPSLKPLQFPSMKNLNPLIDEPLEGIVLRAIQLDPLKRYISVTDFKETLVKYKREHHFTGDKKPSWKASKWKIRSWQFACGTFIIPVILVLFPLIGSILIPDNETGYKINRIIFWLLITAMCSCPVAGLITGTIASVEAAKDRSCEPAGNAMGCNTLIIIALILIHYTLIPNFLRARVDRDLAACESNLKNLATALELYSSDNNGLYPSGFNKLLESSKNKDSYIKAVPLCSASCHSFYSKHYSDFYEYAVSEDCKNFTVQCIHGHPDAGMGPGYPKFNPYKGIIFR